MPIATPRSTPVSLRSLSPRTPHHHHTVFCYGRILISIVGLRCSGHGLPACLTMATRTTIGSNSSAAVPLTSWLALQQSTANKTRMPVQVHFMFLPSGARWYCSSSAGCGGGRAHIITRSCRLLMLFTRTAPSQVWCLKGGGCLQGDPLTL